MGDLGYLDGKTVLVTGAAGTIGTELLSTLGQSGIQELVALDNNESELFFLEQRFGGDGRLRFFVGDVRDSDKLHSMMDGVDYVFHGAALKHVGICERSPFDAVQTNIVGVKNVIDAAIRNDVERVVFMSSDKAVNPTNVMGTSKLMGERLITAANSLKRNGRTVFSSTRFGNVLGSRGSVLQVFYDQVRAGKQLTLTNPAMTRFVMTAAQAVGLVLDSARVSRGGEVFVTKMPTLRIQDLALAMIEEYASGPDSHPGVKTVGVRPGEKMYEELLSEEEMTRTIELGDYFVVLPAFRGAYSQIRYEYDDVINDNVDRPYRSDGETLMGHSEIIAFITDPGVQEHLSGLKREGD